MDMFQTLWKLQKQHFYLKLNKGRSEIPNFSSSLFVAFHNTTLISKEFGW